MGRKTLAILIWLLFCSVPAVAVETAPRISDREIVESLSQLKEGQKSLDKRIDDLRMEMNARFEGIEKRFESRFEGIDKRFDDLRAEMNARFDSITWILGLFISISTIILGFVVRMQWQMNHQQARLEKALEAQETSLETQKDELAFIKGLVEKLLPPKGVL
ncbi:MAG: hypothetical protein HZA78_06415 [Candidatus Schekmanbacteria bacterium]|nr:hypothetical protein [Candidatus Schekmanbacteria bacterium]